MLFLDLINPFFLSPSKKKAGLFDKIFGKTKEVKPDEETRLEAQPWYHGIRGREDILEDLLEPGDYLVRANQTEEKTTIVLNVNTKTGLSNYTLTFIHEQKKYGLGILIKEARRQNPLTNFAHIPRFENIVELVNYYKLNPLPCGNKLKRAITKPKWLIKHSQILYDPIADKIASGNFGSVYRGYFTKDAGEKIRAAIKVCNQESGGSECVKAAVAARESMMHEARLMSDYKFENVIAFFGVACDHPPIVLVMELCPGDSLENHLLADRGDTVNERVLYCYEASRGMRYLHIQGCIHSDLASRNCLISADGILKIADFGLSKFVDELNPSTAKLKIPIRKAQIIQKSDVWAYGVLIFEIFNKGGMPWPGDMPALPEITPATIKALVSKCWVVDLQKRTTFDECYQFLSDYLSSHSTEFPAIEKLAVNQISGVQRTFAFKEDPSELRNIQKTARRPTTTAREETVETGKQNSRTKSNHHRRKGVSKLTNLE
uniref:Tyrosine-protein kinase n=1 Tax=Panagrolaimus superbus TaxID=310955 RepID=A0A914Y4R7_9BILA